MSFAVGPVPSGAGPPAPAAVEFKFTQDESFVDLLHRPGAPLLVFTYQANKLLAAREFQSAVEEVFDVRLLPGTRFPELVGFQKDDVNHTFVVPPAATHDGQHD
jgi:hypothetical protein